MSFDLGGITPEYLAEIIAMVEDGTITRATGRELLEALYNVHLQTT